jgi:cell fate (sporulation/competence/biofilm development) regulator YlbF (YheA/YmcA/DUF963 family)
MFGLFKSDPSKKILKQYKATLEKAMHAQRNGKIREYSFLTVEAQALKEQLDVLNAESTSE